MGRPRLTGTPPHTLNRRWFVEKGLAPSKKQVMHLLWLIAIVFVPFVTSHPLDLRFRSLQTAMATTVVTTSTSTVPPSTGSVDDTFNLLYKGNQLFRNNTGFKQELSESVFFTLLSVTILTGFSLFKTPMSCLLAVQIMALARTPSSKPRWEV